MFINVFSYMGLWIIENGRKVGCGNFELSLGLAHVDLTNILLRPGNEINHKTGGECPSRIKR